MVGACKCSDMDDSKLDEPGIALEDIVLCCLKYSAAALADGLEYWYSETFRL